MFNIEKPRKPNINSNIKYTKLIKTSIKYIKTVFHFFYTDM